MSYFEVTDPHGAWEEMYNSIKYRLFPDHKLTQSLSHPDVARQIAQELSLASRLYSAYYERDSKT
jgi:hypothetical protein